MIKLLVSAFVYKFREEECFEKTVKFTYFFNIRHTGKGLGSRLFDLLESDCTKIGIRNVLVNISSENLGSLNFHAKKGFVECGRFDSVGTKLGKTFDLIWMSRKLNLLA